MRTKLFTCLLLPFGLIATQTSAQVGSPAAAQAQEKPAQAAAAPIAKAVPTFSGTFLIQGIMQANPALRDKYFMMDGQFTLRLTVTPQKIAVDSVMYGSGRSSNRIRAVFNRPELTFYGMERYHEYTRSGEVESETDSRTEVWGGARVDLRDKRNMMDTTKLRRRDSLILAKEMRLNFTAAGQEREVGGYTCRKFIAENKEASVELWVTDKLGITLREGLDIAQAIKGTEGGFAFSKMIGKLPKDLENSFPMMVIVRGKSKDPAANGVNSVIMLHAVEISKEVDNRVFDLSNARIKTEFIGREARAEQRARERAEYESEIATDSVMVAEPAFVEAPSAPVRPRKPVARTAKAPIKRSPARKPTTGSR